MYKKFSTRLILKLWILVDAQYIFGSVILPLYFGHIRELLEEDQKWVLNSQNFGSLTMHGRSGSLYVCQQELSGQVLSDHPQPYFEYPKVPFHKPPMMHDTG